MTITPQKIPTPEALEAVFSTLGIDSLSWSHPPLFSVGDGADFEHLMPGGHTKNLFLKDKKGKVWLVSALQETVIDLKGLARRLGIAGHLSFGKAELLLEVLGVIPGSVTPFGLLNDKNRAVTPVLDAAMLRCDRLNFHPLRNDVTTNITPKALLSFLKHLGYNPVTVDFEAG
jgi:Ala-tRNA(Pro) deacylase